MTGSGRAGSSGAGIIWAATFAMMIRCSTETVLVVSTSMWTRGLPSSCSMMSLAAWTWRLASAASPPSYIARFRRLTQIR